MTASLAKLLSPGVLGQFKSVEVTEVFAHPKGATPINVLTLAVAEEDDAGAAEKPVFLGPKIRLKSLKDWTFGVQRYRLGLSGLQPALDVLEQHSEWRPSGDASRTGALVPLSPVFVPPDTSGEIAMNRVLKNNFWNGSHVLEWADHDKALLGPLIAAPPQVQALAEQVEAVVPIRLAALSDRLGHVIVQVRVRVLMATFGQDRSTNDLTIDLAWDGAATPRPLLAACTMEFDGVLTGAGATPINSQARVPGGGRGALQGLVWDEAHRLVIAASGPLHFIHTIGIDMNLADPEPRTFGYSGPRGAARSARVVLTSVVRNNLIGEKHGDFTGGWTQKRIYQEQANRLERERRFKAYRPTGSPKATHTAAIADLRALINTYGLDGAWLWDPYLGAEEIFDTLFHCRFSGAPLRALSAGKTTKGKKSAFLARQQAIFAGLQGNLRGLKLEFRCRTGSHGWPFHDRFLIFPEARDGALAWSLGTSVNSLGTEHHILQQVDNGRLIADAFEELWNTLNRPADLIWKAP